MEKAYFYSPVYVSRVHLACARTGGVRPGTVPWFRYGTVLWTCPVCLWSMCTECTQKRKGRRWRQWLPCRPRLVTCCAPIGLGDVAERPDWVLRRWRFRPCLFGLLTLAFGSKSQKYYQKDCFWRVFFQKQLFFCSLFLKAELTLFLAFGFLLFEIDKIKSFSIVVLREIKIEGIFYTCLTK